MSSSRPDNENPPSPLVKLVKNAKVYSPQELGHKDILIVNDVIASIEDDIRIDCSSMPVETFDASGLSVFPGIVDAHVHLIGAGGSGGFNSRTNEISAGQIFEAGVTTVVGCLGFDRISRSVETLLVKARALEELGLSVYMLTGSYSFPPLTLMGSVEKDLVLIDKIIGVKLALGETLANSLDEKDMKNLLAECRRGAGLSGKIGFLQVHLGHNGALWKEKAARILDELAIPYSRVVFTHVNRSGDTLDAFADYCRKGGYIDLTASYHPDERPGSLTVLDAMRRLRDRDAPMNRITMSSDSNASRTLPDGTLKYLPVRTIFEALKQLLCSSEFPVSEAVSIVTSNPAAAIGLGRKKGTIEPGKDADLMILNRDFELHSVMAGGKWAVKDGRSLTGFDESAGCTLQRH